MGISCVDRTKHMDELIDECYVLPSGKLTLQWKITFFNGKSHYKWPFSIAMLVYQKVIGLCIG
jgi:hypothetical protein